jgi:hypothetical protein
MSNILPSKAFQAIQLANLIKKTETITEMERKRAKAVPVGKHIHKMPIAKQCLYWTKSGKKFT